MLSVQRQLTVCGQSKIDGGTCPMDQAKGGGWSGSSLGQIPAAGRFGVNPGSEPASETQFWSATRR